MTRNPVTLSITLAGLVALVGAYAIFQSSVAPRYARSAAVLASRSELRLAMVVTHDRGPIAEEDYAMSDLDGVSKSSYRALGRSGLAITIDERPSETVEQGPNVAYFFQQTVLDGIWDLTSRPPRGDVATHYTIDVFQRIGTQHGSRRIAFTDPHYWATTGGHQFHITLAKNKPLPDLLTMTSTVSVDPHYQKVVDDFRTFGPESFRQKVAAVQSRLKVHG